jgi:putative oxygen-independent coproporphyrinogen III oxidase
VSGSLPRELGVYIHYPWCRRLCPYCDFPVLVARPQRAERAVSTPLGREAAEPPHRAYLAAVLGELDERAPMFAGRTLRSIYFGGGTPSLWDPACLAEAIAAVIARFAADPSTLEITVEANPADCTAERMAAWRAAGVNRLSIGVQSWDAGELAALGRDHAMGDGPAALAAARTAGFAALSADLILGAPGAAPADPDAPRPSVHAALATGVPHLSVYELTIEPATAFGKLARAGQLPVLAEDTLTRMYVATHEALTAGGFEHYEVSSYARPGHRAVHNSLYWRGVEYLGLGLGAASFHRDDAGGGARWVNSRQLAAYTSGGAERVAEHTPLDAAELATDELWLAMRTRDGAPAAALGEVGPWLLDRGLGEAAGDRIRPTLRGFLFSDQIAARIVSRR